MTNVFPSGSLNSSDDPQLSFLGGPSVSTPAAVRRA
jgi:hypothetical protein